MASVGIGERLRSARQALGLSLEEIESVTRIQRTYLAALEQEAFDDLPGPTYVRGFLRTYATYLGIPPQELLDLYPTTGTRVVSHRDSPVEVRITPATRLSPARRVAMGVGILLGLGVLFLGVILYGQVRQFAQTTPVSPARTPARQAGPSTPSASTPSPSSNPSVTLRVPGAASGHAPPGPSPAPKVAQPASPSPSGGAPAAKPPASPPPGSAPGAKPPASPPPGSAAGAKPPGSPPPGGAAGAKPPASSPPSSAPGAPAPKGSPAPGSPATPGPAPGAPPVPSAPPGPGAAPGSPPSPPAAPRPGVPSGAAPSATPATPVNVVVMASGTSWVRTVADGATVFEGFLNPGDKQIWRASRILTVRVGNASVVDITLNGRSLGRLGGPGQVYEHTFLAGTPTP
jgi:cytoskeleton protein RodZ